MSEELVKRLRHFGAKPATEQARGCIGSYIALCNEAAQAIERLTTPQAGEVERARRICAQVRPKHADGFLCGDYDEDSTEMRAVLIALSAAPNAGLVEALAKLDAVLDFSELASDEKPLIFADWSALNEAFACARAALDALRGG